jgi:threonylcarbamoyladenosine tRNA methylthiotransferase MtaB
MGRIYTTDQYRHVIAQARSAVQALSVGCDVIVGFPGETDKDFEESLSFCKEMGFARMHVFRFSRRPGTPAATMAGQVPPEVLADRSKRMRALAQDMRVSAANAHICQVESVLVQAPGRGVTGGLFDILLDRSLPVDTLVHVVPHRVVRPATLDACPGTPDVR